MVRLLAVLLLALATAGPASGGVVVGAGVPFSAGELDEALAARDAPADVEVRAITDERVQVTAGSDRFGLALGGARGRVAARLVALHVIERGPSTVEPAPTVIEPTIATQAAPRRKRKTEFLTARFGLTRGVQRDDLTATVVGLELQSTGRIWWGQMHELQRSFTRDPDPGGPVTTVLYRFSLGVGVRHRNLLVGAGPVVGLLWINGETPATSRIWGATAMARGRLPLGDRWAITAGIDLTVFAHRAEVQFHGDTIATTPQTAVTGSLGVTRELGR